MKTLENIVKAVRRHLPFLGEEKPLVSVINLHGVISADETGRKGLSLKRMEEVIEAAFKPSSLSAVALSINSPGGSPVQSRLLFEEIRRHAKEKDVPVLAFIEDIGASGGYILAIAGDEIYADDSSIVGSIGVISGGFGFQEAIARLGIERRVYTSGENKSTLDPFRQEDPADIARLQKILDELHKHFIALVKERRGEKLPDGEKDLFSGAFWAGEQALELGLIDGNARLNEFVRERFGKDVKVKRYAPGSGSLLKRLMSSRARSSELHSNGTMASSAGLVDPAELLATLEDRAMWARFGA